MSSEKLESLETQALTMERHAELRAQEYRGVLQIITLIKQRVEKGLDCAHFIDTIEKRVNLLGDDPLSLGGHSHQMSMLPIDLTAFNLPI